MNKEEIIIINDELFYRIPNGTSYDYAPIPKEFKPYFERLQQENKELHSKIEKAIEYIEEYRFATVGFYIHADCLLRRLKDSDVDE